MHFKCVYARIQNFCEYRTVIATSIMKFSSMKNLSYTVLILNTWTAIMLLSKNMQVSVAPLKYVSEASLANSRKKLPLGTSMIDSTFANEVHLEMINGVLVKTSKHSCGLIKVDWAHKVGWYTLQIKPWYIKVCGKIIDCENWRLCKFKKIVRFMVVKPLLTLNCVLPTTYKVHHKKLTPVS